MKILPVGAEIFIRTDVTVSNTFRILQTPLKIRVHDGRHSKSWSGVYQYCLILRRPRFKSLPGDRLSWLRDVFLLCVTPFSSVPHRASDWATTPSFQMNSKFVTRITQYWRCRHTTKRCTTQVTTIRHVIRDKWRKKTPSFKNHEDKLRPKKNTGTTKYVQNFLGAVTGCQATEGSFQK